jgi:hypothetical protein
MPETSTASVSDSRKLGPSEYAEGFPFHIRQLTDGVIISDDVF